ncbi:protein of unknown function [Enterobacter cancerogenus]|nr:protein of unknown function [Enterobacter cancerogenus]
MMFSGHIENRHEITHQKCSYDGEIMEKARPTRYPNVHEIQEDDNEEIFAIGSGLAPCRVYHPFHTARRAETAADHRHGQSRLCLLPGKRGRAGPRSEPPGCAHRV